MKRISWEVMALALILGVAAYLRLAELSGYFPLFWDEAKYLGEVERAIPYFSVNPVAFALLKLGYAIFGRPAYAQLVSAMVGVLTVLGCFWLGRRILSGRMSTHLGLLMAGQAAVMPYFVKYARHAFPAGFALGAFVFALVFYLGRLPRTSKAPAEERWGCLGRWILAIGSLALVPACAFNLLAPTAVLFVVMEFIVWRMRRAQRRAFSAGAFFVISLITGAVLFFVLPLGVAVLSGYTGWLDRAIALSKSHAQLETMRVGIQCLYPVHLYYLAGLLVVACGIAGTIVMFAKVGGERPPRPASGTKLLLLCGFAVYVGFYGLLSHLQSARLYALTLPGVVFASSYAIIWLSRAAQRWGTGAALALTMLVLVSLGRMTVHDISRVTDLAGASEAVARHAAAVQVVKASATGQFAYGVAVSPYFPEGRLSIESFVKVDERFADSHPPQIVVIHDAPDILTIISTMDKYDVLGTMSLDSVRQVIRVLTPSLYGTQRVYAGVENFSATPYHYLEDVYSWRSYRYARQLLRTARDSIFVYVPVPAAP